MRCIRISIYGDIYGVVLPSSEGFFIWQKDGFGYTHRIIPLHHHNYAQVTLHALYWTLVYTRDPHLYMNLSGKWYVSDKFCCRKYICTDRRISYAQAPQICRTSWRSTHHIVQKSRDHLTDHTEHVPRISDGRRMLSGIFWRIPCFWIIL